MQGIRPRFDCHSSHIFFIGISLYMFIPPIPSTYGAVDFLVQAFVFESGWFRADHVFALGVFVPNICSR